MRRLRSSTRSGTAPPLTELSVSIRASGHAYATDSEWRGGRFNRTCIMNNPRRLHAFAKNAKETARREQAIQREVDRADKVAASGKAKKSGAMQAGARAYPTSFAKQ